MVSNPQAYEGEPIWVTAEEQGIRSASYYWVGSEAPIQGRYPTYWKEYDESVPYLDRVDQVIDWLEMPYDKRPGLVLLYFDEPDHVGHTYGPEHELTGQKVEYLDSVLGYLRAEIEALEFGQLVNLIVLSDHGMGSTSAEKYINLNDHLPRHWIVSLVGNNPLYLLKPEEGYSDSITMVLNTLEGVSAWQKKDIPEHLCYGNHDRYPGIVVVADSLWSIGTRSSPSRYVGGAHGYDNAFTSMHTIFYADGPAFQDDYVHPSFPNVDVYAIIAHILGLQPAENDGNLDRVTKMFSQ
jgi:alkaline phosphatase D